MPIFKQIPLTDTKKLDEQTIEDFKLSPRDQEIILNNQKYDYQNFNKKLAKNYKIY